MRKHLKHMKNEKGLTLVELLAVLVILGIIAAIAVPMIGNIINDSKDKAILADTQMILSGAKMAYTNSLKSETPDSENQITFGSSELQDYIDGIKLGQDDKVTYDGADWTITYSKLSDLSDRFKEKNKDAVTNNSITDKKLSAILKGEEEE